MRLQCTCAGSSIVTALQSNPLSITATCFQYHEYGRRPGLKIRSWQQGVGSSPTFGTHSRAVIESPSRRTQYDSTACYLRPPNLLSSRSTSPQRCVHAARSSWGSLANGAASRMPARSLSSFQCSRVDATTGRVCGGPDSTSFDQAASSALSQSRAWRRSLTLEASSGGGLSLPFPQPASAAAQAAL